MGEPSTEPRVAGEIEDGSAGTEGGVFGSPDEHLEPGLTTGGSTHGARLEGHIEGAGFETPIADQRSGFAEREELGVAGWIRPFAAAIAGAGDDFTVSYDHRSNRHFSACTGGLGLGDRLGHECEIVAVKNPFGEHSGSIAAKNGDSRGSPLFDP